MGRLVLGKDLSHLLPNRPEEAAKEPEAPEKFVKQSRKKKEDAVPEYQPDYQQNQQGSSSRVQGGCSI
jgi:hypothetical protein